MLIYLSTFASAFLFISATPAKAFWNQGKLSAQLHIAFIHSLGIDFFSLEPFALSLKWTTLPLQQML